MHGAFPRKSNSESKKMKLQFDHSFLGRSLYNFEDNLTKPRHRWYPFKEGFSSQLVSEAIKSTSQSNKSIKLLDPFSGSGTTPLSASLNGHSSVGIEVNPFCSFASKIKCTPGQWQRKSFSSNLNKILSDCIDNEVVSDLENFSTFSERIENQKWLFNISVLRAFTSTINRIQSEKTVYSQALKLAAIRSIMMCCNAKKDGKCMRYHSDWKERNYSQKDFFNAFKSMSFSMLQDTHLTSIPREKQAHIIHGDARSVLSTLPEKSFDLLVTSPPYLNSFDYSDVYRPELFLGEFIKTNEELKTLRHKTLRSHVQFTWDDESEYDNVLVRNVVDKIKDSDQLWNKRLPKMIHAYFFDMKKILEDSFRLLKHNSQAWIVVSTSAYGGIQIPVDLILADIGATAGFKLEGVYVLRQLRGSGQQWAQLSNNSLPLRESLIVLRK